MWKLQHYSFFPENTFDVVIPFIFFNDKIILEIYQLEKNAIDWIGWITKVNQSGIPGIEPPYKTYVNQKRYFSFDNYFPFTFNIKSNNYNAENIHLKIHEWIPLEYINSQVTQGTGNFQEIMFTRNHRTNWYLENQGEKTLIFRWGEEGNEWELKPGKFLSGETGKNKSLFMKGESTCEFIESWEE